MRQIESISSHRLKPHYLVAILCVTSVSFIKSSWAQTPDGLHPYAAYSITYDDNVLGLPNQQAALASTGSSKTSDVSRSAQAGLQVDNHLGRQQLVGRLAMSNVSYDRYSQLNYQGRNAEATWKWVFGNHLNGTASSTYVRTLASFDDYHAVEQRIQVEGRSSVELFWQLHPRWRVHVELGQDNLAYDTQTQRLADRKETTSEVGLDYLSPTSSSIGVFGRRMRGTYSVFSANELPSIDSNYEQNDFRVRTIWWVTTKTRFEFSGGAVSRQYQMLTAKNFRGVNARAALDWTLSGHTSLTTAAWRQLGSVDDLETAYSINKGATIGPRLAISQILATDILLRFESRDFRPLQTLERGENYGDVLHGIQWSTTYLPSPHWTLQSTVSNMKKNGRGRLNSFSRNSATITLQYVF